MSNGRMRDLVIDRRTRSESPAPRFANNAGRTPILNRNNNLHRTSNDNMEITTRSVDKRRNSISGVGSLGLRSVREHLQYLRNDDGMFSPSRNSSLARYQRTSLEGSAIVDESLPQYHPARERRRSATNLVEQPAVVNLNTQSHHSTRPLQDYDWFNDAARHDFQHHSVDRPERYYEMNSSFDQNYWNYGTGVQSNQTVSEASESTNNSSLSCCLDNSGSHCPGCRYYGGEYNPEEYNYRENNETSNYYHYAQVQEYNHYWSGDESRSTTSTQMSDYNSFNSSHAGEEYSRAGTAQTNYYSNNRGGGDVLLGGEYRYEGNGSQNYQHAVEIPNYSPRQIENYNGYLENKTNGVPDNLLKRSPRQLSNSYITAEILDLGIQMLEGQMLRIDSLKEILSIRDDNKAATRW